MTNSHPALPRFDYIRPASLEEASRFLSLHPDDARPFLGGTDIFVRLRDGNLRLKFLVDLKSLPGLNELNFNLQSGLRIGSAVNLNRVISHSDVQKYYPLLAEAASAVASYQLRTRATMVGNICNASPAGDTLGAALLYHGALTIYSQKGARETPLADFFLGPGETCLQAGEIVTSIQFPLPPQKHQTKYIKLGRNVISDLSIVGVAVMGYPNPTSKSGYCFHIALASVAPIPLIPKLAEEILSNKAITKTTVKEAAQAASDACKPIDDVRASAEYRKAMIHNLTRQAVLEVWQRLQKNRP